MVRTIKLVVILPLLLVLAFSDVNAQTKPLIPLNIATYGDGIGPWCISVAQERGFFTDVGIRIANRLILIGDPNIVSSLMSGQAAIADGGAATLLPVANGQTDQLVMIAGEERAPVALVTSTAITSPKQLLGTTIALPAQNTSNALQAAALINQVIGKNWTPLYIGGASTSRLAALVAGKAAAAFVNEPAEIDNLGPGFHLMTRFAVKEHFASSGILSTRTWLRQNEDTAVRFLAAFARGCDFILDPKNRAIVVDILARHQPVSLAVADDAYQYYVLGPERGATPPSDGHLDVEAIGNMFNLMKDAGIVTNPNFDYRSAIDLSYLNKALKSPYFKR